MMNRHIVLLLLSMTVTTAVRGDDANPLDQRPQPWQRRAEPILSTYTTKQSWCKIVLYSPHVSYHDGKLRMWYLGTSTATRTNDIVMGYAESNDGIDWKPFDKNPIITGDDIPWGTIVQTPFVMFDHDEQIYKMWFVSGKGVTRDGKNRVVSNDQRLGYATSGDGIQWKIHPKSIYPSGRSPSVIKVRSNKYRMWMGSSPSPDHAWNDIYKNIYEFSSTDGLRWKRSEKPVIIPSGRGQSCVYPFVIKERNTFYMWYGCHIDGGMFELFCANSSDGTDWKVDHENSAFSATKGKTAFDSRYTSTPCVVRLKDRFLMYYSARDWKTEYIDSQGRRRRDGSSPYAHIGVATLLSP